MYLITDSTAITQALDGAAPRPIREIMTEKYPDATIDRNGRAHAPYDGYVCPFTNSEFRAGEFLPFEPDEDYVERAGRKVPEMYARCDGELLRFEGTPAMIRAAREEAGRQMREHDRHVDHVGKEKERCDLRLTLFARFTNVGTYGPSHTHYMRDDDGNPVVYRGSKLLPIKPGEDIAIRVTVKSHWTGDDGRKATYVNRPAIIEE